MGVKESYFNRVIKNIRDMVDIKTKNNLSVTIGLQMVPYARIFRSDNTIGKTWSTTAT